MQNNIHKIIENQIGLLFYVILYNILMKILGF